jgi:hypothetical protein
MSVLDDIGAINDKLADWIINTTPGPGNAAAAQEMKQVVSLHIQLDQLLTQLQLADLQQQNAALVAVLAKQGAQLSSIRAQIAGTTNDIKVAQGVLSLAAQAVAAASQIVTIVGSIK